mmetsp:Transcript_6286/g.7182  ORF Transcript_6286/g.7182 Transcript_6286/m.7182 type:complete len:154 (-) Transcript_6286:292-753(-)|eukprot:CAMPEP_0194395492 /NCGR_PEP_ID=MMETSP0174-20130528/124453_1 /TAXON_ID=216777 /ORGANISM="Proboscia alata, Strain PI-D3" /LENGTH=153 /DNA_ID=CAMNT_0039191435 /DNA_START=587 /DNA_END=1048 /DNA_ORIENTATION=+
MFKLVSSLALLASASAFAPASVTPSRTFGVTQLNAEEAWKPAEGYDWKENDFEGDLNKLQKEAEERLEKVVAKLESGIVESGVTPQSAKVIKDLVSPIDDDSAELDFLKGFDFEKYKKDGKDYVRQFCVELDAKRTPAEVEALKSMDKARKNR